MEDKVSEKNSEKGGGPKKEKKSRRESSKKDIAPKTVNTRSAKSQSDSKTILSPNRYEILSSESESDDEPWQCKVCDEVFEDDEAEVLECMKCTQHFCIKCLGKTSEQYKVMQEPDIMWFCVPCRKQVEKNIETDQKIEEKCQEIMRNYEGRIKALEDKIENKVSNEEVRQIVQEIVTEKNDQELRKIAREVFEDGIKGNQEVKEIAKEIVSNTIEDTKNEITEMTEQRDRDRNFIVYGLEEPAMDSRENRAEAEKREVIEIARRCHVKVDPFNITKIHRLGTYEPKKTRPLLVAIDDIEKKKSIFRNFYLIRQSVPENQTDTDNQENTPSSDNDEQENTSSPDTNQSDNTLRHDYNGVSISHDMTATQREEFKKLKNEAKAQEEQCQGKYRFRVRGPPWALKIVKIAAK